MRKYAHKYTVRQQLFVSNFEFLMLRGVPKVHLIRRWRLCRAGSLFSSAGRCNKNNTWTKQSYEHFKAGGSKRRHDVFLINFPLLTYKTTSEILQMSFRGVCNVCTSFLLHRVISSQAFIWTELMSSFGAKDTFVALFGKNWTQGRERNLHLNLEKSHHLLFLSKIPWNISHDKDVSQFSSL